MQNTMTACYHYKHAADRPVIFIVGKCFTEYCNSLHRSLVATFCTSFINTL